MPQTLTLDNPQIAEDELRECITSEVAKRMAVRVVGDSVVFDPKYMVVGHYYCVELKGMPYLYRKVSDEEIEVYGLAEKH